MRTCAILPAVTAGFWLAAAYGAELPTSDRAEQLVAQLGSPAYREREAASRALDALGDAALDALRRAGQSADAETRRRAAELIERIELRATTASILAPATVALDIHQLPRNEAIAEFNKATGASLQLHSNEAIGGGGRRVTLRTGPVTFWDALEQFCKAADLREWDGLTSLDRGIPPGGGNASLQGIQVPGGGMIQGQIIIRGTPSRPTPQPAQFVLLEGPAAPTPEARTGAVRVRCLPPGTPFPTDFLGHDDVLFPLQVSAEPKLQLQGGLTLRVEKAVDDRGQSLVATAVTGRLAGNAALEADQRMMLVLLNNGMAVPLPSGPSGPVGVKVRKGPLPATMIRELTGSVGAQVRITEPLVVIEKPATAGKSESRSPHGVALAVSDVDKTARGDLKFSIRLSVSPDVQPGQDAHVVARPPPGVWFGGNLPLPSTPVGATEFCGLTLVDAKGRRFEVGQAQKEMTQFGPQGWTYEISVAFRTTAEGAGEPAKLIFTGSRPTMVEVPFTLKDVPLP